MNKIVLSVDSGELNSAGMKAKSDIANILASIGYKKIYFRAVSFPKILRPFVSFFFWNKNIPKKKETIFVFQYPMYSRISTKLFLKVAIKRNVKKIAILHDVESLRFFSDQPEAAQQEINMLKEFDILIVHNDKMKKWLEKSGIKSEKMVTLGIFDYLNEQKINTDPNYVAKKDIVMAGNLAKAPYLANWKTNLKIELMGPNPSSNYPTNISYIGNFNPDELPLHLDAKFGLVWDGDSIYTGSGVFGNYTRFNNPHKVSLYLSMGIPVIVWKEAAISDFVIRNKVGIAIKSLTDLDVILSKMSFDEYKSLRIEALNIAEDLRNARYTKKALSASVKKIQEKSV
ncbi:Glycosyltransferase [Oenococcus oeni]|uniref:sugar transferase n=1 Tax=Oenococcus oeni TaxID=1247 RepID=UPI0010BBA24D|nr:sugar transferase [Oenococcus oeni]SYW05547.1 Glycosyltransferase [Oenococcus oeni]